MIEDVVYKILLLGDPTCGKSTILLRYCDKSFQDAHLSTIGLDYRLKTITLKDCTTIKLQIWDTAGLDRFRAITKNYYKASHGILLIYNVTDIQSFENLNNWTVQIKEECQSWAQIFIVGNNIEDEENRKITKEQGQELADKLGYPYYECSAKEGININEIFQDMVEKIHETFLKLFPSPKSKNKLYERKQKISLFKGIFKSKNQTNDSDEKNQDKFNFENNNEIEKKECNRLKILNKYLSF